jgi:hypothetical protein
MSVSRHSLGVLLSLTQLDFDRGNLFEMLQARPYASAKFLWELRISNNLKTDILSMLLEKQTLIKFSRTRDDCL